MKAIWLSAITIAVFGITACSPYTLREFKTPQVPKPAQFHTHHTQETFVHVAQHQHWWREFGDSRLDRLVEHSLQANLNLAAAWARLRQAIAVARIAGSEQYPQVNLSGSATRTRTDLRAVGGISRALPNTGYFNDFMQSNGLSFEIDLWRRIASQREAEEQRVLASRAEVGATALVLTGSVVETWLAIVAQRELLDLLRAQQEAAKTFLDLTELRFSVGKGSSIAVLQQRQQLASIELELPVARSQLERSQTQMKVLLGSKWKEFDVSDFPGSLPQLPAFPQLSTPAALLDTRPDLVAAKMRLQAAEYDVAVAVAERFPRLSIGFDYNFSASEISDLFDSQIGSIANNASLPLTDGGRRQAEVDRRNAIVDELLSSFGTQYLTALQEVEDALVVEKNQTDLLKLLSEQLRYAQVTLRESKMRYLNGLNDYLEVITALQRVQEVQRRTINEQRNLLVGRSRLYRALGGSWMAQLKPTDTEEKYS